MDLALLGGQFSDVVGEVVNLKAPIRECHFLLALAVGFKAIVLCGQSHKGNNTQTMEQSSLLPWS